MKKRIGVLSLQGTIEDDLRTLKNLNCQVIEVRQREDLDYLHGLIIKGMEMAECSDYLEEFGGRIKELAAGDFPIFGICSGMVMLSRCSPNSENGSLGLMDVTISREPMNVGTNEVYLRIPALGTEPVKAIFLNSLYISEIAPNVGILSEYNGKIVFVRQGNMLASAFYPKDTSDDRIHRYFLKIVAGQI